MVAVLPFDWQVTDSYFVVAHFHYVLNGAVVFPIFGALYYWLPKMTGRMLDERLGKISFWTMFIGFNVTFFPMHILGFLGMPRRVYTYDSGLGWDTLNLIISIASFVFAVGTLLTLFNFVRSRFRGAPRARRPVARRLAGVGDDVAAARVQLRRHSGRQRAPPALGRAAGVGRGGRRATGDPRPRGRRRAREADARDRGPRRATAGRAGHPGTHLPAVHHRGRHRAALRRAARWRRRSSAWSACSSAPRPWSIGSGAPRRTSGELTGDPHRAGPAHPRLSDRVVGDGGAHHHRGDGVPLPARRLFLRARRLAALASPGIPLPELHRSVVFSVVLLASSIPIFWMEHALCARSHAPGGGGARDRVPHGRSRSWATPRTTTSTMEFGLRENAYASLFWVILGLHAIHVLVGLLMSATVQVKVWTGTGHSRAPRDAGGVRAVLALRRRGVALRVRGPLPLRPPPMNLRVGDFPDRGALVWFAVTAGILAWIAHLVFFASHRRVRARQRLLLAVPRRERGVRSRWPSSRCTSRGCCTRPATATTRRPPRRRAGCASSAWSVSRSTA